MNNAGWRAVLVVVVAPLCPVSFAQTNVKTFDGNAPGDRFGSSLANIGDIDSDSYDDFAVGVPFSDANGTDSGQVLVYSGRTAALIRSWAGLGPQDYFGYSIAAACDLDGDGLGDVIVGAPESGELYEAFPAIVQGPGYVQVISSQSGVVIHHVPGLATSVALGETVDGGKDVDGDGVPDVIAGAPMNAGSVLVVSGASGATIRQHAGGFGFGMGAALLGDVDGDGRSEYTIGSPFETTSGTYDGRVSTYSGASGALLWQKGGGSGYQRGWSLARCGDVNGDGKPELLVHNHGDGCWPSWNCGAGLFVYDGATGQLVRGHGDTPPFAPVIAVGQAMVDLGDLDGDGVTDYAASSPNAEPFSWSVPAEATQVWSGASGTLLGTMLGLAQSELFGFALARVDGNGDGLLDILIGDPWNDTAGADSGRVHVYSFVRTTTTYCKAKLNSLGCSPNIASVGVPSVSSGQPFRIKAFNVLNKKNGLLFYAFVPQSAPFQGGHLCVKLPITRCEVLNSGGNPPPSDCSGSFSYDFNNRIRLGVDPALVAGEEVFAQYWSRDPLDPFTTSLTDALAFHIKP